MLKLAQLYNTTVESIKNIDPEKITHQVNNDNSVGINLGTIYQQNNKLIVQLMENQTKLFELLHQKLK